MSDPKIFADLVNQEYTFKGESFRAGCAMLDGQVLTGVNVTIPLRTMNRHGLIAGATGTGKTKTLQVLAEGLSDASVPVLLMDIKGDLSGIAAAGASNAFAEEMKKNNPNITAGVDDPTKAVDPVAQILANYAQASGNKTKAAA